jgi:hypothetical protein
LHSILTNRTINVYGHYPSEKLAKDISEADFRSFLNDKKTNSSYIRVLIKHPDYLISEIIKAVNMFMKNYCALE